MPVSPATGQYNLAEALTDVDSVKAELKIEGSSSHKYDDIITNLYIPAVSQYWLHRTGQYSLSTQFQFTETYDGKGNDRLYVKQRPIASVVSLTIGNSPLLPSTSYPMRGYVVEDSGKSILLRGGSFIKGHGNVFVTYTAGYSAIPADVQAWVTRHVALLFKRRDSINEKSLSAGAQGGSTVWLNDIPVTPDIEAVIRFYSRNS